MLARVNAPPPPPKPSELRRPDLDAILGRLSDSLSIIATATDALTHAQEGSGTVAPHPHEIRDNRILHRMPCTGTAARERCARERFRNRIDFTNIEDAFNDSKSVRIYLRRGVTPLWLPEEASMPVLGHQGCELFDRLHFGRRFIAMPLQVAALPEHAPNTAASDICGLCNRRLTALLRWSPPDGADFEDLDALP